jgi:SAM-dependent methyltransferase
MNIRDTDFVLEIGSGNHPKLRSQVLCDRFIEEDVERGGRIVADRPIVEADAQALPFADQSFDYVICAQVLEHVEDPERMLRELMRVARRGYIETPSEVAERLYGWPFHRSVINLLDGKLTIQRKNFTSPFGELFHVLGARDSSFRRFHLTHNALLLVQYEWEGRIDYEILPETATPLDLRSREVVEELWKRIGRAPLRERWGPFLKRMVPPGIVALGKRLLAPSRPRARKSLREIVVCPACKGPVTWAADEIRCDRCAVSYPILRGIPRLVP